MFFWTEQTDLKFITREEAYKFLQNNPKLSKIQKRDISNNKEVNQEYEFLIVFPDKLDHETVLKNVKLDETESSILLHHIPESKLLVYKTQKCLLPDSFYNRYYIQEDELNALIESQSIPLYYLSKHLYYANKHKVLHNYKLDYNFIRCNFYDLNTTETYKTQDLIFYANENPDRVDWKKMSKYQKIPAIMCKRRERDIYWKIFNCDHFSEASKIEFKDRINWEIQDIDLLSENTIIELYKDKYIPDHKIAESKNETLILGLLDDSKLIANINTIFSVPRTEFIVYELSFINAIKNSRLFWTKASEIEISEGIVNSFEDYISIKNLPNYNIYSDNFIERQKKHIDWEKFSLNTNIINPEFFVKFSKYIVWDKLYENPYFPEKLRLLFRHNVKVDYLKTGDNSWFKLSKKERADKLSRYYEIKEVDKTFKVVSFTDDYKKTKLMIRYERAFSTGTRSHFDKNNVFKVEADIDDCYLKKDYSLRVTKGTLIG